MTAPWIVERLAKRHDRKQFACGHALLDDWLKERSSQFDRRDLSRTYVAVAAGEVAVAGYYAISNHRALYEALPQDRAKGLPRIDIPTILLGRLAVDRSCQGKGLGSFLLIDALRRCESIADEVGVLAIEVHAIDAAARSFYLKFGFIELLDDPTHLFLPMQVIRRLSLPPLA